MSATSRGAKRNEADFYATPEPAFKPLLPFLNHDAVHYDPASGDGRLVRWMVEDGIISIGSDLRPDGLPFGSIDFLTDESWHDVIVTNPPFSLAQEFITHGLTHSYEMWLLLRLNFLASKKRKDWWKGREPNALFVLSERPRFGLNKLNKLGKLGSDACDYAWYYWGRRFQGIKHL